MTGDLPSYTFAELAVLLDDLNARLEGKTPPGTQYVLFVVGGAAMGALFEERTTQDIDVIDALIPKTVRKAAQDVAKKRRMSDQWLNNQVSEMVNVDLPFDAFQRIYSNRNVQVYGAKPKYLLALKLMSGRGKDILDIVQLGAETGALTAERLLAVWDSVYRDEPYWSIERGFVSSTCTDVAALVQRHANGDDVSDDIAALAVSYNGVDPVDTSS